jgi:hypothetical protein
MPGFEEIGPCAIDAASLTALLIFARASGRRPLRADTLAQVFGPGTEVARQALSTLYGVAKRIQAQTAPSRAKRFFQEWDRLFGVVYGQDIGRAEHAAEETARQYRLPGGADLKPLLFTIHTYYAFLMKLMAIELLSLQPGSVRPGFASELAPLDDDRLRDRLTDLESGGEFSSAGIDNFLEADFFSWYLDVWSAQIARNLREVARNLGDFETATPRLEPRWTQDLLRNLYETIVPKKLRHDLGEYYTPDWLAEHLLDRAGYGGEPGKRVLDPACGSGTFLIHAIRRALDRGAKGVRADPGRTGRDILGSIVGFDLNPMAVLAARTNYLIAISELIPHVRPISVPVYLCDSVVPLERPPDPSQPLIPEGAVVFSTHDHDYVFPVSMKAQEKIDRFTAEVDKSLRAKMPVETFGRTAATTFGLADRETEQLAEVYRQIKDLHDRGLDGIWARYIKNAFAPEYVGRFDLVVGNPPWVRWKYLSDEYRRRTLTLWHEYGIFSLTGHAARLGGGEKDFSMLFTYACADRYLKDGGTLVFLITETVFKARGGGEGFRRFVLPARKERAGTPLKLTFMEDMVDLNPFLTASNKTCMFGLKRGAKTTYPVPVVRWRCRKGVGRTKPDWTFDRVRQSTECDNLVAFPVDRARKESSWQTATAKAMARFRRMKGVNPYLARLGAYTAPYGVFRLRYRELRPDKFVVVENMPETGKAEIRRVTVSIESKLIHPAVNGPEIVRFGFEEPFHVLLTQDPSTREPYPVSWMEMNTPMTLAYLRPFEKLLLKRGSKPIAELARKTAFYAMFGVGEYSVAPYRVTWARTTSRMAAVVLSRMKAPYGMKPVIGCDHTTFIPLDDRAEAHYVCAVMNSTPVQEFLRSACPTAEVGPPSAIGPLAIPKFRKPSRVHGRLAELSEEAHARVARGANIGEIDAEIDRLAEALWTTKS